MSEEELTNLFQLADQIMLSRLMQTDPMTLDDPEAHGAEMFSRSLELAGGAMARRRKELGLTKREVVTPSDRTA